MTIRIEPLTPEQRKPIPEKLVFGRNFTDRMFMQTYSVEKGWHNARITAYQSLTLDPATAVFHYSQEIFEGTKAYRRSDGKINLFRTWENVARFNRSAERMSMAQVDPEQHFEAIAKLVALDHQWVPKEDGAALYIRPVMIATETALGVHASHEYLHYIILAPVGPYFSTGFKPVSVFVSDEYVRAVRGGTGAAKTGGNYSASLYVSEKVKQQGYQQVLWLDAVERRYVEEVGAMNIAFVYEGDHIVTPSLTGSILPGITRDSLLKLAPDLGFTIAEARIEVDQMVHDIKSGRITEVFGMGTAAVVAPVGKLGYKGEDYIVNNYEAGPVAQKLYKSLTDIQYGRVADPYDWTYQVEPAE